MSVSCWQLGIRPVYVTNSLRTTIKPAAVKARCQLMLLGTVLALLRNIEHD